MNSSERCYSVVEYRGHRQAYSCGYCHGTNGLKYSAGMWAHSLTVQDYQDLIDRGWRRSGKYVYKPSMNKTCCPQYVIKCPASEFTLNKSHKKLLKRNNRYFNTGIVPSQSSEEDTDLADVSGSATMSMEPRVPVSAVTSSKVEMNLTSQVTSENKSFVDTKDQDQRPGHEEQQPVRRTVKPGAGADPNKPPCKKAKLRRLEKKLQKQAAANHPGVEAGSKKQGNEMKTLEEYLSEVSADGAHKLEIRLVRSSPRSREFDESFDESYQVYKKYQMAVHNDPPDKPTERQYTRFLVDSPLQSSLNESYNVWKKYQQVIHKEPLEDCDKRSFSEFLVASPLEPVYKDNGLCDGLGSFHQQYLVDGRIIAVGVMDILPHCVSSVYLYYDPDYRFLTLGTYTALRELAFVRQLYCVVPSIKYYYMGFYIHSCPKMKYKGQYNPSFLLCPETYGWFPIESCRPKLDNSKYCRFDETGQVDVDGDVRLDEVLCLYQRQAMDYALYRVLGQPTSTEESDVRQYASLIGMKVAQRMLLYRAPKLGEDDSD